MKTVVLWACALQNGTDLVYVSTKVMRSGSVELASLMKKGENSRLVQDVRQSFVKVFTCILVENHTYITMVSVTNLFFLHFRIVLHLWKVCSDSMTKR